MNERNSSISASSEAAESMPLSAETSSGLVSMLWRQKGIVLFFAFCGLGFGYLYFCRQAEVFRSASTIEVFQQRTDMGTNSAVEKLSVFVPNTSFINAEMTSDEVMISAVNLGKLTAIGNASVDVAGMISMIRNGLTLTSAVSAADLRDRCVVQVAFDSPDPGLSSAVVNAVVEAYTEHTNGRHRNAIGEVVDFFREGKESVLPKLDELEREYQEFRAQAPLEWTSNGEAVNPFRDKALRLESDAESMQRELRRLAGQVRMVTNAVRGRSSMVDALRDVQYLLSGNAASTNLGVKDHVAGQGTIPIKSQLMELEIAVELMADQFAENHPQRRVLMKEYEITKRLIQDAETLNTQREQDSGSGQQVREENAKALIVTYVSGLNQQKTLLEEELKSLEDQVGKTREKAKELVAYENENASFIRRIQRNQSMLESFESQLEKADLPTINSGLRVRVLRPAGYGTLIGPLIGKNLGMGLMLGALLGCLIGFLSDWSDRTFRSPDEVDRTLGISILTHIPFVPQRKKKKRDANSPHSRSHQSLMVLHDRHSAAAESIRSLRTHLLLANSGRADYQIVQVTSTMPGDGKSTVAANLAASVAMAGRRVLLIDADLRRPTQHQLFGVEPGLGLSSVLDGACSAQHAIQTTDVEGLMVMPSGPCPSNPAEALAMPELGQMMEDLRAEYDLIVIDSPPMLAVTDSSTIAHSVDGVLFVMRIGRNVRPMAKRAISMLNTARASVIGVAVNAIGDNSYSIAYANAWSETYGGRPGGEYTTGYYRYGSNHYLDASKGQGTSVRTRGARDLATSVVSEESSESIKIGEASSLELQAAVPSGNRSR